MFWVTLLSYRRTRVLEGTPCVHENKPRFSHIRVTRAFTYLPEGRKVLGSDGGGAGGGGADSFRLPGKPRQGRAAGRGRRRAHGAPPPLGRAASSPSLPFVLGAAAAVPAPLRDVGSRGRCGPVARAAGAATAAPEASPSPSACSASVVPP